MALGAANIRTFTPATTFVGFGGDLSQDVFKLKFYIIKGSYKNESQPVKCERSLC